MRVGLIDCDRKNSKNIFPNLALMKLSAWHKKQGDAVEWYEPLFGGHFDKVYVSMTNPIDTMKIIIEQIKEANK